MPPQQQHGRDAAAYALIGGHDLCKPSQPGRHFRDKCPILKARARAFTFRALVERGR